MEDRRGGACRRCRGLRDPCGQSTVEFLLVAMVFAALCLGMAAMWHAARDGRLLALASNAASHNTAAGIVVALKDIMAF